MNEIVKRALESFVATIDNVGGVIRIDFGAYAPVGDEDWLDLGSAYLEACSALNVAPKIAQGRVPEEECDE